MSFSYTPIAQFEKTSFTATTQTGHAITHDIYTLGKGAPIVIVQELPGISKENLRLADKFVAQGFQVILPHLFGPLEQISIVGNLFRVFCMRKEFHLFKSNKSSPIVDWLKALCRKVKQDNGMKGVGVIGMCLTGNFAISLMGDDSVLAAVSSQPSMPIMKQKALHMSDGEIAEIKENIDKTAPMLAYRFKKDPMCTADKFQCIQHAFNEGEKERIKMKTLPGKGHSVLTLDFVDREGHPTHDALQEVIQYFSKQLK